MHGVIPGLAALADRLRGPGRGPRAGALPAILSGRRRWLFLRLVANGAAQAAATVALPFVISSAGGMSLATAAGALGGLGAALMALRVAELRDAERLGLDYVAETRLGLFDGLMEGRASTAHGIAMSRLMNDLSALRNWVGLGLARSVTAGLALVGCLAAGASLSPVALAAIGLPVAGVALAASVMVRPLGRRTGEVRTARGRLARLLGEALLAREMLVDFGQTRRMRRRVSTASDSLTDRLRARISVAAALRGLPDTVLPGAVVVALLAGLPAADQSVGIVLLAGIAAGPLRQAMRAIEYRAAFAVGRDRLSGALGTGRLPRTPTLPTPAPGLHLHPDHAAARAATTGAPVVVCAAAPILRGSLRRNIDVARRHRGDDAALGEIARQCGLPGGDGGQDGLDTRLDPDREEPGEEFRARLSLARSLAAGRSEIIVDAPVLLITSSGRSVLRALPECRGVAAHVVAGDAAALFGDAGGRPLCDRDPGSTSGETPTLGSGGAQP